MKVVIADDIPANCRLLEAYLHKWGFETVSFYRGQEVYAHLINSSEPSIVILDWMMPDKSGIEICSDLRQQKGLPPYYMILLTAKSGIEDLELAFKEGADDFVNKPFNDRELRSRLTAGKRIIGLQCELERREIDTRLEVYRVMTELAELKDRTTGEHVLRVGTISERIARSLEMSDQFCMDIKIFARFHDIGKIGIADSLLLAERKLTTEEFEVMKEHTTLGFNILKDSPFMKMAADIVIGHHERFDGNGYPNGISGEDIPISARIVSVADVYDALRSKRPYKESMQHDIARKIIKEGSGTFFDPKVVDAFLQFESELGELDNNHFDV